jgi:putative phosphoesterase
LRVAALYDIHGNLPALEAVLAEVEREDVDGILVGGDIAAGPLPRETLELVRSLDARAIRGNADVPTREAPEAVWVWEQLDEEEAAWLGGLPESLVLEEALYCHATPRSDCEIVTELTTDEKLGEALVGVEQPLVVAGHTHMRLDRRLGSWRFVNPGSIGMPYEPAPGAYWALVEGTEVELRRTEYDLERAAALVRASGHPLAEELAAENVLRVPSRDEALAAFGG